MLATRTGGADLPFYRTELSWLVSTIVCLLATTGCRMGDGAVRVAVLQPLQYSNFWHDKLSQVRYRSYARDALEEARALARAQRDHYCPAPFSPGYEMGFLDGFTDYLYAGGSGEPPPLPPRKFWRAGYQTPHGHQAAVDWFTGFRHGAASARVSGLRRLVMIPVSDSVLADSTPYPYGKSWGGRARVSEFPAADADRPAAAPRSASPPAMPPDADGQLRRLPQVTLESVD